MKTKINYDVLAVIIIANIKYIGCCAIVLAVAIWGAWAINKDAKRIRARAEAEAKMVEAMKLVPEVVGYVPGKKKKRKRGTK